MTSTNGSGNGPDRNSHQPDDNQYGFDYTAPEPTLTDDEKLARQFEEFHANNGHVYTMLVMLARRWVTGTGQRKLGARVLWERMRWELNINSTDEDFALNNNYIAFYARLLMVQEPDLANLFNLRSSAADAWITERAA